MQDYRKLDVWAKAHRLTLDIYKGSKNLPREETFGLTMQLRRLASSIPMKIASACGREAANEKAGDILRATAAANELEYAILLASELTYVPVEVAHGLTQATVEVRKMLFGLLRTF